MTKSAHTGQTGPLSPKEQKKTASHAEIGLKSSDASVVFSDGGEEEVLLQEDRGVRSKAREPELPELIGIR